MILIAKTEDGKYFSLIQQNNRHVLRKLRKEKKFFCPQCNESLLLKVGEFRVPYFSHYQRSRCESLFSEGESETHLNGKAQLYRFFEKLNVGKVKLEPYIAHLSQRPDLLYVTKHKCVPIEFQCSRIPTSEIKRRTASYKQAQMDCQWILQTPEKLTKLQQGTVIYSISKFEENFIQISPSNEPYFFTYDANSRKFHYLSSLMHINGRKVIGNHRILSISNQHYPFLQPNPLTKDQFRQFISIYNAERKRFLKMRVLYNRQGIRDSFLRQCYELKLIPTELPEWIGVPMNFYNDRHVHDCEWQLALLYFLSKKNINIHEVDTVDLYEFISINQGFPHLPISMYKKYVRFLEEHGFQSIHSKIDNLDLMKLQKSLLIYLQNEMKIEKI